MNLVYLLIGGNIGNRQVSLEAAVKLLEQSAGKILKSSSLYETAAWGNRNQPQFLNQVLAIETSLVPLALLENILLAEESLGRIRTLKNAPRIIDIDILFYKEDIIDIPGLRIPHPEIANRRFVLEPMVELAPSLLHPVLKKTVSELLSACTDQLDVRIFP